MSTLLTFLLNRHEWAHDNEASESKFVGALLAHKPKPTKSQAMAPLAWLMTVIAPVCLGGLIFAPQFAWLFISLLLGTGTFYLSAYSYWAVKAPDRLGSERYETTKSLMGIADVAKNPKFIDAVFSEHTGDPTPSRKKLAATDHKELPDHEEEE